MFITEQYINKLVKDIISTRDVPIRAAEFMTGDIGNDDDPNTKLIKDRCSCNQADVEVETGEK